MTAPKTMQQSSRRQFFLLCGLGILALAASVMLDQSLCPVYNIVGLPCPSCGMTRAFRGVLAGEFSTALWQHPLFWVVPVLPLVPLFRKKIGPIWEKNIYLMGSILFLGVWVVRMLLFFPRVEPLVWNSKALLPWLWRQFM